MMEKLIRKYNLKPRISKYLVFCFCFCCSFFTIITFVMLIYSRTTVFSFSSEVIKQETLSMWFLTFNMVYIFCGNGFAWLIIYTGSAGRYYLFQIYSKTQSNLKTCKNLIITWYVQKLP